MLRKLVSVALSPLIYKRCKIDTRAHLSLKSRAVDTVVLKGARLAEYSDVRQCVIGDYSTIGRYTKMIRVEVGKFSAISWDVTINAVTHPYNHATISAFPYVKRMGGFVSSDRVRELPFVKVGSDVWIGANAVVMPGVEIGTGAVVGAGSVVTKDVQPYTIVAGVPARVIKKRFEEDIANELLLSEWWSASDDLIKKNISLFQKPIDIHLAKQIRSAFE